MGDVEIPKWLKGLPLAPEFHPTDTEFSDPIAYISKIEKEASAFGICKIIPPLPKPSKKYVISNLNKSLLRSTEISCNLNVSNVCSSSKLGSVDSANEGEVRGVFTTRHQELGQSVRKTKGAVQNPQLGVHKQVWQSGEVYTLEQFESKSKVFARGVLSGIKEPSPLVVESLFWKAAFDKPIYVEYANDVPGSAFGEPVGKFRYFHRRRRKRNYYHRSIERSSELKSGETANLMGSCSLDNEGTSTKNNVNTCPKMFKSSTTTVSSEDTSRGKSLNPCSDMEGTAGWKLSNSPWNLQVIARSPGSLTRFMPDDIPGVTSPMVYIGMMFSWFAWHVEDHELHSMNYLHVGSPKTWYAVPGDYAIAFEEVVRTEAYGGSVDHLAALTLLGEKTTLLSPETVIASGIPCCRLIQNPGEFVVTFPRAYHVGFSHGFNCGEAANFGTPQWLSVAKEAAVRRAAMNYLPMLSHQQLLYLLTMSFVSRVPRSLLPGVRSSRLRDRQKEERELLVKKEFVEDILRENNMLSVLLEKESSCRAVLWNPDMLPYSIKESQMPNTNSEVAAPPRENMLGDQTESRDCTDKNMQNSLINELTLDLETMNDIYLENDDLSCDFQVDSGTLACVACGILGFPFMSVVQPSEKASKELLSVDNFSSVLKRVGVVGPEDTHPSPDFSGAHPAVSSSVPDVNCLSEDLSVAPIPKLEKGWNRCSKLLRPRSFCLQHAVEIIELLQNKGGAKVLVICHSDYHKIKANAVAIAEEIGNHFVYNEVQLDIASEEDLRLIYLAVDEESDEHGEDWTSKLGINLRHSVKVRKKFPTKQVQHALELDGLFFNQIQSFNLSTINWLSKKTRSKKVNHPLPGKTFNSMPPEDGLLGKSSVCKITKREEKFVQYYRRNKKSGNSTGCGGSVAQPSSTGDSSILCDSRGTRNNTSVLETGSTISNLPPSVDSTSTSGGRMSEVQIENCISEDIHIDGESCDISRDMVEMLPKIKPTPDASLLNERDVLSCSTSPLINANDESFEIHQEQEIMGIYNSTNEASNIVSEEGPNGINLAKPSLEVEKDNADEGKFKSKVCDDMLGDDEMQQELKTGNRKDEGQGTCNIIPIEQDHYLVTEDGVERDVESASNEGEPILTNTRNNLQTVDTDSENPSVSGVFQLEVQQSYSLENEKYPENLRSEEDNTLGSSTRVENETCSETRITVNEHVSNSGMLGESQSMDVEAAGGACAKENLTGGVILDNDVACADLSRNKHGDNPSSSPIQKSCETQVETRDASETCLSEIKKQGDSMKDFKSSLSSVVEKQRKRKRYEEPHITKSEFNSLDFIRSPCEGLRPRVVRNSSNGNETDVDLTPQEKPGRKKVRNPSDAVPPKLKKETRKGSHKCDLEGCRMSFKTKAELALHKCNQCPHEGCGRKFSSHKYAMLHQRVHDDDRPLKCPWKGCSMSFKWAWARTEHIRVHTGERPYKCKVEGCGLSFRFVSDFSRHRRKTGHYVDQPV